MKAVETSKDTGQACMEQTCRCFNLHRDAYYKFKKRRCKQQAIANEVIELVKKERLVQPRVGTRKPYEALHFSFEASSLKVGRDKLFDILREQDMLIKR